MAAPTPSKFYAMIIGINYYPGNQGRNNLYGCVADANAVEAMLRQRVGADVLEIHKMTAVDMRSNPMPNRRNVVAKLREISAKLKPGDSFFFFYSGHGIRMRTPNSRASDEPQHPDQHRRGTRFIEGLALQNDFLKDYEFGAYLKELSDDKQAQVVVMLDCCHAGGADRNDGDVIRSIDQILPYSDYDDSLVDAKVSYSDTNGVDVANDGSRAGTLKPSYWTEARNYTLFAACQPHQVSREFPIEPLSQRRGIFTKAMIASIQAFANAGEIPSYNALYEDIYGTIGTVGPGQVPGLFGRRDLAMFGRDTLSSVEAGVVQEITDNGQAVINRGTTHGVAVGDQYKVHHRGALDLKNPFATIRIYNVEATTSQTATRVAGSVGNTSIQPGCPVSLHKSTVRNALRVAVESGTLLAALRQTPSATVHLEAFGLLKATHQVLTRNEGYVIADMAGTPLPNRPPFPNDANAVTEIDYFLRRLALYTMVMNLHNRSSRLEGAFEFREAQNLTEVYEKNPIELVFKNKMPRPKNSLHAKPLFYSVFNLTDDWHVGLMIPNPKETHQSKGIDESETSRPEKIDMSMPGGDEPEIIDTFKAIVTTVPAQFSMLDTRGDMSRNATNVEQVASALEHMLEHGEDDGRQGMPRAAEAPDWQTATITIKVKRAEPDEEDEE